MLVVGRRLMWVCRSRMRVPYPEMVEVIPVILSGGSGTRLWPLSRHLAPKQLQSLVSVDTMLQATAARVGSLASAPVVVANVSHLEEIRRQLPSLRLLIGEPEARNTAPAVTAAAALVDREAILLVLPADQHIEDVEVFRAAVEEAVTAAGEGYLVTFGVVPSRVETGFGHIIPGEKSTHGARIERFVEKPDPARAAALMEAGALWNGGMFAFRAGDFLDEVERLAPDVLKPVMDSVAGAVREDDLVVLGRDFGSSPSVSIDVAVMERTSRGLVVPLDAGWSDVGSWESLWELGERDAAGNLLQGDVVAVDVTGSYLRSEGPLVAVVGVEGLVVVATPDAVLVADRHRTQEVKRLVAELADRREAHAPPEARD
jgi:mannose-1-phosphate guanylyltransferase/mannose-6-phosphate isomerase